MIRIDAFVVTALSFLAGSLTSSATYAVPRTDQLANMTYTGIFENAIALSDGRWEGEPFMAGSASRPTVGLVDDFMLSGDLDGNGDDEAVVLLWENTGGPGNYLYIAVAGTRDDQAYNMDTALVGERVEVRSGRIVGNRIELDVIESGPDDVPCCPSQKSTRSWTFDATGLHVNAAKINGKQSLSDLGGVEWKLRHLDAHQPPLPSRPEITLVFDAERIAGSSGCNRYFAAVQETGELPGDLKVSEIGGTRMACATEIMDLEDRYLEALRNVTRYSFLAGKLVLTWRQGQANGMLLFAPQQPTSP